MCEPAHSIDQFPDHDDYGPTEPRLSARREAGWWSSSVKKIKTWFHFSRSGFGHDEPLGSLSQVGIVDTRIIPHPNKYEADWCRRKTELAGRFQSFHWLREEAAQAAHQYAWLTSIGNLHLLRQFLEASLKTTHYPYRYLHKFYDILNVKGRDEFRDMERRVASQHGTLVYSMDRDTANKDGLLAFKKIKAYTRLLVGFTRKRELLVPEWADDAALWIPEEPKLLAAGAR